MEGGEHGFSIQEPASTLKVVTNSSLVLVAVALVHAITYGIVLTNGSFIDDLSISMNRTSKDVAVLNGVYFTIFNASYVVKCIGYKLIFNVCGLSRWYKQRETFDPIPFIVGIPLSTLGTAIPLVLTTNYDAFGGVWITFSGFGNGLLYWETFLNLIIVLPNIDVQWKLCGRKENTINWAAFGFCICTVAPTLYGCLYALSVSGQDTGDGTKSLWFAANVHFAWISPILLLFSSLIIWKFTTNYNNPCDYQPLKRNSTPPAPPPPPHCCCCGYRKARGTIFQVLQSNCIVFFLLIAAALFQYAMYIPFIWIRPIIDTNEILSPNPDYVTSIISFGGLTSSAMLSMIVLTFPISAIALLVLCLGGMVLCLFLWPFLHILPAFLAWGFWYGYCVMGASTLFNLILIVDWDDLTPKMDRYKRGINTLFLTSLTLTLGNFVAVFVTRYAQIDTNTLIFSCACCATCAFVIVVVVGLMEACVTSCSELRV